MYFNQLIWILFLSASVSVSAQCNGFIISKYVEGSSYNKGLELTNASKADIQLNDYQILVFLNGGSVVNQTISFSDSLLASRASVTIVHQSATVFSETNYEFGFSFTGDDAIALVNIVTNDTVDVLGVIGDQPNQGWGINGVSKATQNHTLVRNADITQGSKDWTVSQNTWSVFPEDTLKNFGLHQLVSLLPNCDLLTGLPSEKELFVTVSPTAISQDAVLHFTGIITPFKLQVIDIKGNVVEMDNSVTTLSYQMKNDLSSGIYFLRVWDTYDNVKIERLMVE